MKNLFITSLFILITSCAANSTSADKPSEEFSSAPNAEEMKTASPALKDKMTSCTCVKIWMPVCGENKKTYGNSCEADCAGVKYTAGECKKTK